MDIKITKEQLASYAKLLKRISENIETAVKNKNTHLNSLGELQGTGPAIDAAISKLMTLIHLKEDFFGENKTE